MTPGAHTVLVVEDQRIVAADLESTLENLGYVVRGAATSGEEAIEKATDLQPDLVLMDIRLRGEMDGIEAARIIRERFDVPVVFLTAYVDEETIRRAKAAGPFGYVVKPYNERELRAAIEIALHKNEMDRLLLDEKARRRTAEQGQRRSAFLAHFAKALGTTLDREALLERVARLCVPFLGATCLLIEMPTGGPPKHVAAAADPLDAADRIRSLHGVPVPDAVAAMIRSVIETGHAARFDDFTGWLEKCSGATPGYVDPFRALQTRSVIVAPIPLHSSTFGVLLLGRPPRAAHTPDEIALVEEVAQRIGLTLDNVRLYCEAQETAQTFRLLVEGVKDYAIFKLDVDGHVTTWNAGAERIEGYREGEVLGRHFSLFYPPEEVDRGTPSATLQRAMAEGRAAHEGWCVRKDGTRFWADVVISPLRDDIGFVLGFAEVTRDLTERKHADDAQRFLDQATVALASSLDVAEALERASRFAVPGLADWCVIDLVNELGVLVPAAASHADRQKEALAHRLVNDIRPRETESSRGALHAFHAGRIDVFPALEEEWSGASLGSELPELMRALGVLSYLCVPIQYRDETLGVVTLLRGAPPRRFTSLEVMVTEDFARRAGLSASNAQLFKDAQRAVRVRDEFLQVASHELRTPLTPMQLQIDSLARILQKSGPIGEQLSTTLDVFSRQLDRLNKLVETLLDVSRITAGRLFLQLEELDFVEVVRDVIARHQGELTKAGCELTLSVDGPIFGRWDRLRVDQIFSNLLSNAIKYGSRRPVEVDVQQGEATVRCVVRDHGIGIEKEAIERIFGRFERGVSARNYGGLGLGLYIVRQIAESHGGTIIAQSQPGQGATFTLVLPRQPSDAAHFDVDQIARGEG